MPSSSKTISHIPAGFSRFLPGTTPPLPDELLSSWLVRLAHRHYLKVHSFCSVLWPRKEIWTRDIDRSFTSEMLTDLSILTGTSYANVFALTLQSFEGILFHGLSEKAHNHPWILALERYHRIYKKNGLMYCPSCLKKDGDTPYFRKRWRLALSIVCPTCGSYLHDCCPQCKQPVIFYRNELGRKNMQPTYKLSQCHNCQYDLSNTPAVVASREIVDMQVSLYEILELGWDNRIIYPFQYFDVMRSLTHFLSSKAEPCIPARIRLCEILSIEYLQLPGGYPNRFETLSIPEREHLLRLTFWLLNDWPIHFKDFFKQQKVRSFWLLHDYKEPPFWYFSHIYENFYVTNINRTFTMNQ